MPTINGKACVIDSKTVDKVYSNGKIIYGRNLLTGTIDYSGWSVSPIISIDNSVYPNVAHYPLTTVSDNGTLLRGPGLSSLEPRTTYTFDFKAKGSGTLSAYIFPDVSDNPHGDNFTQYQLTADWETYRLKFITRSSISGIKYVMFRNDSSTLEAYITQVKLEKGDTATPWTPAPEDVM